MRKRRVIVQIQLKEFQKCQDTCQNLQDASPLRDRFPLELVKCISDRRLMSELVQSDVSKQLKSVRESERDSTVIV